MQNVVTLKYSKHHGQLLWSGRTAKASFAAAMVNTPEEMLAFGQKHFPGREVKVEAV